MISILDEGVRKDIATGVTIIIVPRVKTGVRSRPGVSSRGSEDPVNNINIVDLVGNDCQMAYLVASSRNDLEQINSENDHPYVEEIFGNVDQNFPITENVTQHEHAWQR